MSEIQIKKLGYPDNIRQNVGMYLGSTSSFTTPLREIINNAEDELLNGYADNIVIVNRKDVKAVMDNGRGIPAYADPDDPTVPITISVVSETHVGSKFDRDWETITMLSA